jgi:hypothetical protein
MRCPGISPTKLILAAVLVASGIGAALGCQYDGATAAVSWPDESGGGYEEVGLKPALPSQAAVAPESSGAIAVQQT